MPSLVSCSSSGWSSAPVVIEGTGGPRGTPRCVRARAERPSPCPATHVDSHDWPEVVARDAPFRIRLPRGVREIPGSTRQIWRLPFGTVSYGLVERSRSWLDSISADSTRSPYWICTDSTEAGVAWVHSFYGNTHFGRGLYLDIFWWLGDGRELSLIGYSRDSSARDTLLAIARSIKLQP